MRNFKYVALALLVALGLGVKPGMAITNGESDANDDYPYVGRIVLHLTNLTPLPPANLTELSSSCSGSLIDSNVMLAAGHCTIAGSDPSVLPPGSILTYYATFDRTATVQDIIDNNVDNRFVGRTVTNPAFTYNPISFLTTGGIWGNMADPGDIGLIIFEDENGDPIDVAGAIGVTSFPNLAAVGSSDSAVAGDQYTSVGYGFLGGNGLHTEEIGASDERRISVGSFIDALSVWLKISQNIAHGDGGSCIFDSGGPVIAGAYDGVSIPDTIAAVTSHGDGNCVAISKAYRIDTEAASQFICSHITNGDDMDLCP